jgi:hypothetical protein
LLVAYNIGAIGYLVGIAASAVFNTPTGASIVCALVPAAILCGLILRGTGLGSRDEAQASEDDGVVPTEDTISHPRPVE